MFIGIIPLFIINLNHNINTNVKSMVWREEYYPHLFSIIEIIIVVGTAWIYGKKLKKITNNYTTEQHQHIAKIDSIRKEHAETLEKIRVEMLKREEDRNRQWMESEKETLLVLGGVSNLLDISEKINRVESDKIQTTLEHILNELNNERKKDTKVKGN